MVRRKARRKKQKKNQPEAGPPLAEKKNYLAKILIFGIIPLLIIGGIIFICPSIYYNKIFPGVKVGSVNLGGKTYLEALDLIEAPVSYFNEQGLIFIFQEETVSLQPTVVGTDIDLSYEILSFDSNPTIKEAYEFGRGKDYWTNLKEQWASFLFGHPVPLAYYFNKEEIKKSLQQNFSKFEIPHKDASLVVNKDLSFTIEKEELGTIFDYDAIVNKAESNVKNLTPQPIYLKLISDQPEITITQAEALLPEARKLLTLPPLTIRYQEKNWEIDQKTFSTWLDFHSLSNFQNQKEASIGLNPKRVGDFLESIRNEIDIEVKEGKFRIEEGKVIEFQSSQPGTSLEAFTSIQKMEQNFIEKGGKETELVVVTKEPEITTENVNNLGIKELIGVGKSDFSGSPRNRRANIKLGADKLNGILIKPEEEFSLLKALGKFEATEGWLPELVIKGNRTIPELGGGACQFGTTMFRAALTSGLPVTARQSHSYTVTYYYPIGTDATIYDPAPDLKFINDTGHYILIQTKIEGNNLIFELWGIKDGRIMDQTAPRLYGWQDPPPEKVVETEDLAPGEEKCTEKAHKGVSAEFTYKVTYSNGEIKEEVFQSKYKPWQKVCLKGVEKKSEEKAPNSVPEKNTN